MYIYTGYNYGARVLFEVFKLSSYLTQDSGLSLSTTLTLEPSNLAQAKMEDSVTMVRLTG